MGTKSLALAVFAALCFLGLSAPANAIDTRGIETVRAKKVLDTADLQTIDAFVAQAVTELAATTDFSSISNARSIVLANSSSKEPGQVQFADQFSESAKKHVFAALAQADALTAQKRKFRVITNLLMLLDDLADLRLVDLPLKYVNDNNTVIRYWAVHCLTNPDILNKLNSAPAADTARLIARRLEAIVATSSPETLGLSAGFAAGLKITEGEDLLLKLADRRIASYADWTVQYELLDVEILQLLSDKMASSNPGRQAAGRRFGQLFSYVFQRYIKGADILTPAQKEQLVSVLVETEKSCLVKLTGKPQSAIKKAVESGDPNALVQEHNNLLGDAAKTGQLPAELNFDFGKAGDGSPLKAPLALADPPKK